MTLKELVLSIRKAKSENLSFMRWVVRVSVQVGKSNQQVENLYLELLKDCAKLEKSKRLQLYKIIRFPQWKDIFLTTWTELEFPKCIREQVNILDRLEAE